MSDETRIENSYGERRREILAPGPAPEVLRPIPRWSSVPPEEMPVAPASPYAVQKLASEHYCRLFHRLYGLPVVVTRYFNVFGPRQQPNSPYSGVISLFIKALASGTTPIVLGDVNHTDSHREKG